MNDCIPAMGRSKLDRGRSAPGWLAQFGNAFAVAGIERAKIGSQWLIAGDERLIAEIEMCNRTSR
jgi:hypothetical protein